MAKIVEYRDIPLDALVIGKGQARTENLGAEIEDLKKSIAVQGLLQPIVVCPARESGKWEILTGQRRFLAHKSLEKETISAAILDERVDAYEAKAISLTENLLRRKLSGVELKDALTFLYTRYGSVKDVAEKTGMSQGVVRDNVNYDRLIPELKKSVDDGLDVKIALKAQDVATNDNGVTNPELAITFVKEMKPMTGTQRKKFAEAIKDNPDKPIDEAVEAAKTGAKVTQIIATVTQDTHRAIQKFAKREKTSQDEAAVELIEASLKDRGFL